MQIHLGLITPANAKNGTERDVALWSYTKYVGT